MQKNIRPLVRVGLTCIMMVFSLRPPAVVYAQSCGDTITRSTTLTADLIGCPGNGLVIGADHVRLNLNGHTVSGQGGGVGVLASGRRDVRVRNGTIQQFGDAVRFEVGTTGSSVRNVVASGNTNGIVLDSSDANIVSGNTANSNGQHGIHLVSANDNEIDDNIATGNGSRGILLDLSSNNNQVTDNTTNNNGIDGIILGNGSNGNRVSGNTASANLITGIVLFGVSNIRVNNNRTNDNVSGGIFVFNSSTASRISNNQAHRNGSDGIGVEATDAATRLSGNRANDNGDLGIDAPGTITDGGGNRASGNNNSLQCTGVRCR